MTALCNTCRFWVIAPGILRHDGVRVGQCRRYSPESRRGHDGKDHTQFPCTREDLFCGEHEAVPA